MSANETIRNKYLSKISLWNFHFLFIDHKVSFATKKVFIQFEKGDGALSENNYVFIVRPTNSQNQNFNFNFLMITKC